MSDLTINKTIVNISRMNVTSNSPYDSSTSENGLVEHTYYNDAQRYEFSVEAQTLDNQQYAQFTSIMDQVGGHDSILLNVDSYSSDIFPYQGNLVTRLFTLGTAVAGSSIITYNNTTSNPSGVAPNGTLAVGDFLQIFGKPKLYKVVSLDQSANQYNVYPPLKEEVVQGSEIIYGPSVRPRVKMDTSTFTWMNSASVPLLREYSFNLVENPF